MHHETPTDAPEPTAAPSAMARGTVTRVDGARVGVRSDAFGAATARVALPHYRPRVGDEVLIAGDVAGAPGGARFVVGVLRALREVSEAVVAEDGSRAALEADEEGQVLRVRDGDGALVFEHRAGRSVVHAPRGDLAVRAEGVLSLRGERGVRVEGGPELSLEASRARLRAEELRADAGRARLELEDASVVVGTLRTVAHRVRERVEVVERTAGRVVERARESYREVEGLAQTRAGRVRMVAQKAFSVLGEQATLKAREDLKIKGRKIYLS